MILESLVTTIAHDGSVNIAPMGPRFDPASTTFELRPFDNSNTYQNLLHIPTGVLHVTDDVLLIARAAIDQFDEQPEFRPSHNVSGAILIDCCRWYEFETTFIDASGPRVVIQCRIVGSGRNRDFFGFNRAKHAVIEAAILATRIDFLPREEIASQFERMETMVHKTGGDKELQAFALLKQYVHKQTPAARSNSTLPPPAI